MSRGYLIHWDGSPINEMTHGNIDTTTSLTVARELRMDCLIRLNGLWKSVKLVSDVSDHAMITSRNHQQKNKITRYWYRKNVFNVNVQVLSVFNYHQSCHTQAFLFQLPSKLPQPGLSVSITIKVATTRPCCRQQHLSCLRSRTSMLSYIIIPQHGRCIFIVFNVNICEFNFKFSLGTAWYLTTQTKSVPYSTKCEKTCILDQMKVSSYNGNTQE